MTVGALARQVEVLAKRIDLPRLRYEAALGRHRLRVALVQAGAYMFDEVPGLRPSTGVYGTPEHYWRIIDPLTELGDDTAERWERDQQIVEAWWAGRWSGPSNVSPMTAWGASPPEMWAALLRSFRYAVAQVARYEDQPRYLPLPHLPNDWDDDEANAPPWPLPPALIERAGGRRIRYRPEAVQMMRRQD